MSLLVNTLPSTGTSEQATAEENHPSKSQELTVVTKSVVTHESAMSDYQKQKARENAPDLKELLADTLNEGNGDVEMNWDGDIVEVKGASKMALHNFILKAEEQGKTVTYTKTYQVSITD